MEAQIRIVHWYDTEVHRSACGAPGLSNSTKYVRAVTCSACRALVAQEQTVPAPESIGAASLH